VYYAYEHRVNSFLSTADAVRKLKQSFRFTADSAIVHSRFYCEYKEIHLFSGVLEKDTPTHPDQR